ncbi:GNAT family N-acetyltransferase [Naasia aerilata]|uniref:N-acetyltransferase n=1 Tax=Naasia aerilata TaxID=1162966 RepID=A0ABN6XL49_9MICO|nr:GNAT family N-acetyltransferase [Naasia aerilata]BDZ45644.1 N-acetyltransferase [Naasia aerilata]
MPASAADSPEEAAEAGISPSAGATIRRATPRDAGALAALAARTFPLACPPGTTAESIAAHVAEHLSEPRFQRHLADETVTILVAESGELVGYTMLIAGEPTDPDVAAAVRVRPAIELSKAYVDAGHHGAGLAARLMAATLAEAASSGARSVWLGVNDQNARAIRFYTKSGFAVAGPRSYRVGEQPMTDHVMVAPL